MHQADPQREFVALSESGSYRVLSVRPVDHLLKLLQDATDTAVADFFRAAPAQTSSSHIIEQHQAQRREACATCLIVICSEYDIDRKARQRAVDALKRFGGEPQILTTEAGFRGGADLGRPIVGPRIVYSGRHDGLYLYLSRTVSSIWGKAIAIKNSAAPSELVSSLTRDAISELSHTLGIFNEFLASSRLVSDGAFGAHEQWEKQHIQRMLAVARPRTAVDAALEAKKGSPRVGDNKWASYLMVDESQASALENESLASLYVLTGKTLELLALWDIVLSAEFSSVLGELADVDRQRSLNLTFAAIASTDEGERFAKEIIGKLLKRAGGSPKYKELNTRLAKLCPTLHSALDVLYAEATEQLGIAQATKDVKLVNTAMTSYRKFFTDFAPFPLTEYGNTCDSLLAGGFIDELVVSIQPVSNSKHSFIMTVTRSILFGVFQMELCIDLSSQF